MKTKQPLTTLCYIEKDKHYLMMHRTKKENDVNKDKWIGVGGHFEAEESPEDCLLREVREETGLILQSWQWRGVITFITDNWPTEYMFLYTSDDFAGELKACNEGDLQWVEWSKIKDLPIWTGDKIFLQLLADSDRIFSLKLVYNGEELQRAILDGKEMDINPYA